MTCPLPPSPLLHLPCLAQSHLPDLWLHRVPQTGIIAVHASALWHTYFPLPGAASRPSPGGPGHHLLVCEDAAEASPPESFPDTAPIPAGLGVPASVSCRAALFYGTVAPILFVSLLTCEPLEGRGLSYSFSGSLAQCLAHGRMWMGRQSCFCQRESRCQKWAWVCLLSCLSFCHARLGGTGLQKADKEAHRGPQAGESQGR